MGQFRLTIDIGRPPTEVIAFLAEPRNMPRWYDAVDDITQTTEGHGGIGTRYRVTRSLPSGQRVMTSKSPSAKSTVASPSKAATARRHSDIATSSDRAGKEPSSRSTGA